MNLPVRAKIGLIKGLVATSMCITDKLLQKQYLDEILIPITNRYNQLMLQSNLSQIYQNEDVKMKVTTILEEIKAALSGITMQSANLVFDIFKPILIDLHRLLELYHNYVVSFIFLFKT